MDAFTVPRELVERPHRPLPRHGELRERLLARPLPILPPEQTVVIKPRLSERLAQLVDTRESSTPTGVQGSRERELDELYSDLRRLARSREPGADAEYRRVSERLRMLQRQEAEQMASRYNDRRALPRGKGYAALQLADELIARYAHLTPENGTSNDPER